MTDFLTIKKKVLTGFNIPHGQEGEIILAAENSINDALYIIASEKDFDELIVTDTTNAETVDGTKTYSLVTDFGLTRPKKILTMRLMDDSNSRRLTYVPSYDLDKYLPYAEQISEGRPTHYTNSGEGEIELLPIADDAYSVYIRYSQWPATLTADDDDIPISNIDTTIVFLSKQILLAYLNNEVKDFNAIARKMLYGSIKEENRRPDEILIAKPYSRTSRRGFTGNYWLNPFVERNPR